jgi:hypothetical protein
MRKITHSWQKLFLLCFGIFLGTTFCMKWMEADFIMGNNKFTINGLEISYSQEQVSQILSSIDQRVKLFCNTIFILILLSWPVYIPVFFLYV